MAARKCEGINTLISVHFFDELVSEAVAISIWLHLGTVLAAIVYFRREVAELLRYLPRYVKSKRTDGESGTHTLITFLIVSTVMTGVVGGPLMLFALGRDLSDESYPSGAVMAAVGVLLIFTGLVQRIARKFTGTKTQLGAKDAALLGVVQGFAALPGLSRSGLTVSAFLFRGYSVERAIKVSFLMSIPVVLAAEVGLGITGEVGLNAGAVIGVFAAFVFGLITIGAMIRAAARVAFWKFCLFLGVLSLIPLLIDVL